MIKIPSVPQCVEGADGHQMIRTQKFQVSFNYTCYHCGKTWHIIRKFRPRPSRSYPWDWKISGEYLIGHEPEYGLLSVGSETGNQSKSL